jgi:hypothetical protein
LNDVLNNVDVNQKNINVEVTWFLLVGTKNRPLDVWIDTMNLTNVKGANINASQSLDMQFAYKSETPPYITSIDLKIHF